MIDQNRLQELVDDFGADDFLELIESFLEEATGAVQALEAMISDVHMVERSEQFHFLKGCALNVGAMALADVCERFENRHTGFSADEYQRVKADFDTVQGFFADGGLKNVA